MIALSKLSLQRGPQVLLDEADLRIFPGKRVGVIGQNGCGKSSLFKLLLGELHGDTGDLSIPVNWRIAHMAQEVSAADRAAVDYVLDGNQDLRRVEAAIAEAEKQGNDTALAKHYAELEAIDGFNAHYRAEQLLHGLSFTQDQISQPVNSFSGGWRIRLNLAQALMCPSDLLLLDEPTNHLDLDAALWLEQWLKAYQGTLLLISHDRDFLDNITDEIVHFESRKLVSYRGGYSAFERQRAERLMQQQASYEKQQQRITEINRFVSRFRAQATKAKQAQSRLKELGRMEQIAPAHVDSPFHFVFSDPKRSSNPLINLTHVELGYGDTRILKNINLSLQPGSRIGLLGPNGAGKSTLIKALVGDLPVQAGERMQGEHLYIGYFAQHQLEALDLNATAVTHIQRLSPDVPEQKIRDFLGGFNFHGDKAQEPIKPFSGGEKARLALAMVVWQRPNLLLLDEPTNHLDLEMRHALTVALQGYGGALVVISHDRHLLRNTVDEFLLVSDGKLEIYKGDLADYQSWLKTKNQEKPKASTSADQDTKVDKKTARQEAAAKREQFAPMRKELKQVEKDMDRLQAELARIEEALGDPDIYEAESKAKLQDLIKEQGASQKALADLEERWLGLQEGLEALV